MKRILLYMIFLLILLPILIASVVYGQTGQNLVLKNLQANEVANVKIHGAKGDGVTNDSAAFASAFATGFRAIYIPKGRYLLPNGIDVPSDLTLIGDHPDSSLIFTKTSGVDLVRVKGTLTATTSNATAKATRGQTHITVVSSSGFSVGDTVYIKANGMGYGQGSAEDGNNITAMTASGNKTIMTSPGHKLYTGERVFIAYAVGPVNFAGTVFAVVDSILTDSTFRVNRSLDAPYVGSATVRSGTGDDQEINIVDSIQSNVLVMRYGLYDTYHYDAIGNRIASVTKINPKRNVNFRNLSFRAVSQAGGGEGLGRALRYQYAWNGLVENCKFYINLRLSIYESREIHFNQNFMDSSATFIEKSKFCSFTNNTLVGGDNPISVWKNSDNNLIADNKAQNITTYFYASGNYSEDNTVSRNKITVSHIKEASYVIQTDFGANRTVITDNTLTCPNESLQRVGISATGGDGIQTIGNTITGFRSAIFLEACKEGTTADNLLIFGGDGGSGFAAITMDQEGGPDTLSGNRIDHNTIIYRGSTPWTYGIKLVTAGESKIWGGSISRNTIIGVEDPIDFIERDSSKGVGITNNIVSDNIAFGIPKQFTFDPSVKLSQNLVSGNLILGEGFGHTLSQTPISELASADTVVPTLWVDFYTITGTTKITSIIRGARGKVVRFTFDSSLVIMNGKNLLLGTDSIVTTRKTVIGFISDGTNWIETSRVVPNPPPPADLSSSEKEAAKIRAIVPLTSVYQPDGVDDRMLGSPSSAYFPVAFKNGTIEMWFYLLRTPTSSSGADAVLFLARGHDSQGAQDSLSTTLKVLPNRKIMGTHYGIRDSANYPPSNPGVVSVTILDTLKWYHVAWNWNGTNQQIILNGVLDATAASPDTGTAIVESGAFVGIAYNDVGGASAAQPARVAELRDWNKTRTASEVLTDYQGHLLGSETNLKAYYRFDKGRTNPSGFEFPNQVNGLYGISISGDVAGSSITLQGIPKFEGETVTERLAKNPGWERIEGKISTMFAGDKVIVGAGTPDSTLTISGGGLHVYGGLMVDKTINYAGETSIGAGDTVKITQTGITATSIIFAQYANITAADSTLGPLGIISRGTNSFTIIGRNGNGKTVLWWAAKL